MRSRETGLRDLLRGSDPASADAVNPNSIQTFFVVLADYLLEAARGRLVLIAPTTALVSAGVLAQRRLLARRFVIEHVVTSHEHGHQAFSRDSKVFESIVACRRRRRGEHPEPTVFTALARMPRSTEAAVETARCIGSGRHHPYTLLSPGGGSGTRPIGYRRGGSCLLIRAAGAALAVESGHLLGAHREPETRSRSQRSIGIRDGRVVLRHHETPPQTGSGLLTQKSPRHQERCPPPDQVSDTATAEGSMQPRARSPVGNPQPPKRMRKTS